MEDRKIRIAITHGDTNGTGYEIILKAFEDPAMLELCTPIVYGSPKVAAYHRKLLNIETQFNIVSTASEAKDGRLNLLTTTADDVKVEIGQATAESEAAARTAVERAVEDGTKGLFDALVTLPSTVNQTLLRQGGVLPVLVSDDLRMAFVTADVAVKDVSKAITTSAIVEKGLTLHRCLKRDLMVSNPRIAILALNPPSSDGTAGEEEQTVIAPAIAELEQKGVQAFGPYPADLFFGSAQYLQFDAVLAMYHDQGMVPFRTIAHNGSTMLSAGMEQVHTAPTEDAGLDIAGKGVADPTALRQAIYLATDVARNRKAYDEPMASPLPKLYHEKRDDSEKVRFAVPKTKDTGPKRNQLKAESQAAEPQEEAL